MLSRSRLGLKSAVLTLVAVLAAVPARAADAELDKFLPADTEIFVRINIRQLLDSKLVKDHLDEVRDFIKQVDELNTALEDGNVERWRSRYRLASALLIDDVQFLADKERVQEELFSVFNDLHAEGKQIVLSSDRTPGDLVDLEERLRTRFTGGDTSYVSACPGVSNP